MKKLIDHPTFLILSLSLSLFLTLSLFSRLFIGETKLNHFLIIFLHQIEYER